MLAPQYTAMLSIVPYLEEKNCTVDSPAVTVFGVSLSAVLCESTLTGNGEHTIHTIHSLKANELVLKDNDDRTCTP